jgi:hypothetical protein
VFPPGKPVFGAAGSTACAPGESATQAITSRIRNEPGGEGAWFIGFLRFALNDVSVWRIIFFIICGFSRLAWFLGIRRIAYEFY